MEPSAVGMLHPSSADLPDPKDPQKNFGRFKYPLGGNFLGFLELRHVIWTFRGYWLVVQMRTNARL